MGPSQLAVIHTGPADRAARWLEAIRGAGFDARPLAAIEPRLVELTSEVLGSVAAAAPYRLVVVTSPRAAEALGKLAPWIEGAHVAAVGPATGKACADSGFPPKWTGASGGRTFREALATRIDLTGMAVLPPCGDLAQDGGLPELAGRGARVVSPVVYRTVAVQHPPGAVRAAAAGAAAATFTSPSGVRSFCAGIDAAGIGKESRLLFAATLGPATEAAAQKAGFSWRGVSRRPEPDALADLLSTALRRE
jgi:uroporphyrinogen-III synthase